MFYNKRSFWASVMEKNRHSIIFSMTIIFLVFSATVYATDDTVRIIEGHKRAVISIALDDQYIYTSSTDNTIKIWSKKDGALINTLTGRSFSIMVDKQYIYSVDDNTINIWNKDNMASVKTLKGHKDVVNRITTDGKYVYSTSTDKTIKIWSKDDWSLIKTLEGHTDGIVPVVVDNQYIYSGSADKTIRIWSKEDYSLIKTLHFTRYIQNFKVDDKYIYVAYSSVVDQSSVQHFEVWSKTNYSLVKTFNQSIGTHFDEFVIDDRYIYSSYDGWPGGIEIWNKTDGSPVKVLEADTTVMFRIALDEQYICSGYVDGTIMLWKKPAGDIRCGNGKCDTNETCISCPTDCLCPEGQICDEITNKCVDNKEKDSATSSEDTNEKSTGKITPEDINKEIMADIENTGSGNNSAIRPFIVLGIIVIIIAAIIVFVFKSRRKEAPTEKEPLDYKSNINPKAYKYVTDCLQQGLQREAIEQKLLESGYTREQVNQIFTEMNTKSP